MWFPSKEAIDFLNSELLLPVTGCEQDWEIELADSNEIAKFLNFYETQRLSPKQQQALMVLVISSFEDALTQSEFDEELWGKAMLIVRAEPTLFKDVLECWICSDSDADDEFEITPFIKALLDEGSA